MLYVNIKKQQENPSVMSLVRVSSETFVNMDYVTHVAIEGRADGFTYPWQVFVFLANKDVIHVGDFRMFKEAEACVSKIQSSA